MRGFDYQNIVIDQKHEVFNQLICSSTSLSDFEIRLDNIARQHKEYYDKTTQLYSTHFLSHRDHKQLGLI